MTYQLSADLNTNEPNFNISRLGTQLEIFQGRRGLVRLGHFYKHFVKSTRKKGLSGKNLGVFSPRYSWNYIFTRKFNSEMDTIRAFFTKSVHFSLIFKKGQGRPPPPPPVARLTWISDECQCLLVLSRETVEDVKVEQFFRKIWCCSQKLSI